MTTPRGTWTFETLLTHLLAIITDHDRRYTERFELADKAVRDTLLAQKEASSAALLSSEKAIEKAEVNAEKWRENANEWRGSMTDRENRFMGRDEALQAFKAINDKLDALNTRLDKSEGRGSGVQASWSIAVALLGMIGVAIGLIFAIKR